jgi:micrococcal nuclease
MYEYKALIISVYDGDTVTALVDLGFFVKKEAKLRLYGIDTPEIRGEEREKGLISKLKL